MNKLQMIEKIYKEIAEEDKRLCEAFLSISLETIPSIPLFFKEGLGEITGKEIEP
ncbi:MAG: hypothetical protein AB1480_05335 [Nitrospirota bacterium]